MQSTTPVRVSIGDTVTVELPFSEVCMHLGVAGRKMKVRIDSSARHAMAQILDENGKALSFPVLMSEAGFYHDQLRGGFYYYPPTDGK